MLRLKVNYQKQRTDKESMKMIIQHFKVNLPVQNESGDHIWIIMRWIFEQKIFFILSGAENVQNRNF